MALCGGASFSPDEAVRTLIPLIILQGPSPSTLLYYFLVQSANIDIVVSQS